MYSNENPSDVAVVCRILQWKFLVRLFDDTSIGRKLQNQSEEFLAVHDKFLVRIYVNLQFV